jgi:hypothetical protein
METSLLRASRHGITRSRDFLARTAYSPRVSAFPSFAGANIRVLPHRLPTDGTMDTGVAYEWVEA